jgi:hypothetical protein
MQAPERLFKNTLAQLQSRWRRFGPIRSMLRRGCRAFCRDEAGAELVQFALVIPIVVGIIWFSVEAWQLMTLRTTVRDTAAQAARYITAYAGQPESQRDRDVFLTTDDICVGVQDLVNASLSSRRGIDGDALSWELLLYRIDNKEVSDWENNRTLLGCYDFIESVRCEPLLGLNNEQFAIELAVVVPWRSILFGLSGVSETNWVYRVTEVAMGSVPCEPFINLEASAQRIAGGPGGCRVQVMWDINASFVPNRVEVFRGSQSYPACTVYNTETVNYCEITVPSGGTTTITVIAYGLRREEIEQTTVYCP